jgi:hypothetical protein
MATHNHNHALMREEGRRKTKDEEKLRQRHLRLQGGRNGLSLLELDDFVYVKYF